MKLKDLKGGDVVRVECYGSSYVVEVEKVEPGRRLYAKWFYLCSNTTGEKHQGGLFLDPDHVEKFVNKPLTPPST